MPAATAFHLRIPGLIAGICILAVAYFATAELGLILGFANTNAAPVWPAAGIALAAMLLWGPRLTPGVWVGAFAANLLTFSREHAADQMASSAVSAAIATGNTFGAFVGWRLCQWWMRRKEDASTRPRGDHLFERMSVLQFGGAAMAAAIASALVGPFAVCLSQIAPWSSYKLVAFTWWCGDATGILFVTPFILSLASLVRAREAGAAKEARNFVAIDRTGSRKKTLEQVAAFTLLIVTCWFVFGTSLRGFPASAVKCLPIVVLTWIALRMGVRGTTFALIILASFVIWTGRHLFGELNTEKELEDVLVWIAFLWAMGLMFLALAAAADAHKRVLTSLGEAKVALEAGTANEEVERELRESHRLEREMLDISEKERRALGEDLHDGLCQHLTGLSFMAETLTSKLREKGLEEEAGRMDGLTALIRSAASQARAVARGLRPVEVDSHGLLAALSDLATRSSGEGQVACRFHCARPVLIEDNRAALHLFRIAQDAVLNAIKHTGAREIVIDLTARNGEVTLTVSDDGRGSSDDPSHAPDSDLHLMRYRASVIGGKLMKQKNSTGGTIVTCVMPLSSDNGSHPQEAAEVNFQPADPGPGLASIRRQ